MPQVVGVKEVQYETVSVAITRNGRRLEPVSGSLHKKKKNIHLGETNVVFAQAHTHFDTISRTIAIKVTTAIISGITSIFFSFFFFFGGGGSIVLTCCNIIS